MNDQRIVFGTPFGDVDALDRARVERVGAESVHGLRRKGDEAAAANEPGRARNDLGAGKDWIDIDANHDSSKLTCSSPLVILGACPPSIRSCP